MGVLTTKLGTEWVALGTGDRLSVLCKRFDAEPQPDDSYRYTNLRLTGKPIQLEDRVRFAGIEWTTQPAR